MTQNKIFAFLLMSIALIGGLVFFTVNALSDVDPDEVNNIRFYQYKSGVGADGYDVVAYFEESRAVAGKQVFETNLGGMPWHFTSLENRQKFLVDPLRYLPRYGGHCAYAVAQGYLAYGDPKAWSIHDESLYFNYNKNIRNSWLANAEAFIKSSKENWPHKVKNAY